MFKKKLKKRTKKKLSSKHETARLSAWLSARKRALSVSVVLVEQLKGGQCVMVLEQRDKQFNSREFSTTEISLQVSRSER